MTYSLSVKVNPTFGGRPGWRTMGLPSSFDRDAAEVYARMLLTTQGDIQEVKILRGGTEVLHLR